MTGKAGTAPCGHRGEHVTANYVRCLEGCDRVDRTTPAGGATVAKCPQCGGEDVEPFSTPLGVGWHCIVNGHVWWN